MEIDAKKPAASAADHLVEFRGGVALALAQNVSAPRARTWTALTDPRELEQWFCEHADVSLDDHRYDFWGRFTPGVPDREQGRHAILEIEPHRLLRYSLPIAGAHTTVEYSLDGDTRVHVLHTGVPERGEGAEAHVRHLWSNALGHLRAHLEMGRPGPRFGWSRRRA